MRYRHIYLSIFSFLLSGCHLFESTKVPSKEIKSIGDFEVLINLHPEVQTQIVIKTVPQEEIK